MTETTETTPKPKLRRSRRQVANDERAFLEIGRIIKGVERWSTDARYWRGLIDEIADILYDADRLK